MKLFKNLVKELAQEIVSETQKREAEKTPSVPVHTAPSEWVAHGVAFADRYRGPNGPALQPAASTPSRLEQYFDAHTQGRGIWKFRHYFDIYDRYFRKFVGREVHVVEIGVASGGSLGMWQDYFGQRCKIYGVDILPRCKAFESDSVKIFVGDQGSRDFWKRFKAEVPRIDVVIDDGSHWPQHQMITADELLPHVRAGGVYLCEDLFVEPHPFHEFISGIAGRMHVLGDPTGDVTRYHHNVAINPIKACVRGVHTYPHAIVIEMNDEPNTKFECPKHGTQW